MKRSTAHTIVYALIVPLVLSMSGCTFVSYCPVDAPCITVFDLHPVGGAVDLTVQRNDGTTLKATRNQASSEDIITGVVNALNPIGELMP